MPMWQLFKTILSTTNIELLQIVHTGREHPGLLNKNTQRVKIELCKQV